MACAEMQLLFGSRITEFAASYRRIYQKISDYLQLQAQADV